MSAERMEIDAESVRPREHYWLIPNTRRLPPGAQRPWPPRALDDFSPVPPDEDDTRIPDADALPEIVEHAHRAMATGVVIRGSDQHYRPDAALARLVDVWPVGDALCGTVEFDIDTPIKRAVYAAVDRRIEPGISVELAAAPATDGRVHYAITGFAITDQPRMPGARVMGMPRRPWAPPADAAITSAAQPAAAVAPVGLRRFGVSGHAAAKTNNTTMSTAETTRATAAGLRRFGVSGRAAAKPNHATMSMAETTRATAAPAGLRHFGLGRPPTGPPAAGSADGLRRFGVTNVRSDL